IADLQLGPAYALHITSLLDGTEQIIRVNDPQLDEAPADRKFYSAIFNGSSVRVDLELGAGSKTGRFTLAATHAAYNVEQGEITSLCGADDRTLQNDACVMRIIIFFR